MAAIGNLVLRKFLVDSGSSKDATGDYSGGGAETFAFTAGAGTAYLIHRFMVTVSDSSTFEAGTYGGIVTLTNGWEPKAVLEKATVSLTDGVVIKDNEELFAQFDHIEERNWAAGAILSATMEFSQPIYLPATQSVTVDLNDNFTGLSLHRFMVIGHEIHTGLRGEPIPL